MHARTRTSVTIVGALWILTLPAACGNHGAPPYAPETTRAALPAATSATAASSDPHAVYDLRERCGADAREWHQHAVSESGMSSFTSHYDLKANVCFALTTSVVGNIETQRLANVLENRELGSVSFPAGAAPPAQWQALISSYMNDQ